MLMWLVLVTQADCCCGGAGTVEMLRLLKREATGRGMVRSQNRCALRCEKSHQNFFHLSFGQTFPDLFVFKM